MAFSRNEIRKVEILSSQYNHPVLKFLFFFAIFLVAYAYGLDGKTRYVYTGYAAASYQKHSEYATINVVQSVIGAGAQFFFARMSDTFGRFELFVFSIVFYVVGTIIQSQAYDIERFSGGSVLYQIGYSGVIIILQLILADNSNLNWRLVCSFIPALPFIINTWISGNVTGAIGLNWSWGIAMWAFIFPLACIPLLLMLIHQRILAGKTQEFQDLKAKIKETKKPWKETIIDLFWDTDIIGIILLVAVLELILVPLTLTGGELTAGQSAASAWRKAKIIAPLVIGGFLCFPLFIFWEWKVAKHPLVPFALLKDRGVYCAIVIGVFVDFVWYLPNDYLYTILVVAVNESYKSATRITSLYSFVSVITGSLFGLLIVYVRRLKKFIIFGTIIWFVANGLLIKYKGGGSAHSGIIGALCLYGFGAGFFTYPTQASIQTCTNHDNMAGITALYLSSYNVGAALGACVSAAVWTNTLYTQLVKHFEGNTTLAASTYADPYTFALNYTWGSVERTQAVAAYSYVQKILSIVGLCLCIPLIIAAFGLRDYKLESVQSLSHASPSDDDKNSSAFEKGTPIEPEVEEKTTA